jgi:hypothetical protein
MATNRQASASVASEDRRQRRAASNKAGQLAAGSGRLHVGKRRLIGSALARCVCRMLARPWRAAEPAS